jgi:hypothetical protein
MDQSARYGAANQSIQPALMVHGYKTYQESFILAATPEVFLPHPPFQFLPKLISALFLASLFIPTLLCLPFYYPLRTTPLILYGSALSTARVRSTMPGV